MQNWTDLTKAELETVAPQFGVLTEGKTKAEIVKELIEEEQIPFQTYLDFKNAAVEVETVVSVVEEVKPLNVNDRLLVRMSRQNPYYEIRGYTFTQEQPFVLMPLTDAEKILEIEGFYPASPKQAEEFFAGS